MASRSIICQSQRLRQIIDLRDTDKSRYFAITEFNNCFIIRSPIFLFLMNILGKRSDLPFSRKGDPKKEKSTVCFTHEQNIICSQTLLDGIAHEQTIISRQIFAGHVVGSRPMKRKKNFVGMILPIIGITDPLDSDLIILQIALSNFLNKQGHMFVLWTYLICFKLNEPVFSCVFLGLYHDCEWFSFSDGS